MLSAAASERVEIVEMLYAGVQEPSVWTAAVALVAKGLGATDLGLHRFDFRPCRGVAQGMPGFSDAWVRDYNAHFCDANPWMARARGRAFPGGVTIGEDLVPDEE